MNTPVYLADIQAVKDKQKVKTVVRGHPREREAAATYILEMASGYFGWNEEAISRADAIEIKLGQSAKPGLGGELLGAKVTAEIAAVRGISPGTAAHSPARFPDLDSIEQLRERISWIRSLDGGGIGRLASSLRPTIWGTVCVGL